MSNTTCVFRQSKGEHEEREGGRLQSDRCQRFVGDHDDLRPLSACRYKLVTAVPFWRKEKQTSRCTRMARNCRRENIPKTAVCRLLPVFYFNCLDSKNVFLLFNHCTLYCIKLWLSVRFLMATADVSIIFMLKVVEREILFAAIQMCWDDWLDAFFTFR